MTQGETRTRRRIAAAVLGGLLPLPASPGPRAQSYPVQTYPARPVRIVLALSAGSQADLLARVVARHLSEAWGQPVLVENHPGGAGQVAGQILVGAAPDGHTLMIHSDGHAVSAALYAARLPYDTLRDIARIALIASSPSVLVVSPALGAVSVAELVALARTRPGGLTFGSAGIGGGIHFTGEMFKQATGIPAIHVPFRGMPEALTEVMASRVDFAFSAFQPAAPLLRDGRLRALAVSAPERSPALPEVPTVAEAGYPAFPGYELWWGVFAPAATPAPVVERIAVEVARIVARPELRDALLAQGITPRGTPPAAFDAFVRAEVARLADLIRTAGIVPQ